MKKPVLITTAHRGVFFGYITDETLGEQDSLIATDVRNCIYWTKEVRGFLGLAVTGPLDGCTIGPAVSRAKLLAVTSITDCSKAAEKAWLKAA